MNNPSSFLDDIDVDEVITDRTPSAMGMSQGPVFFDDESSPSEPAPSKTKNISELNFKDLYIRTDTEATLTSQSRYNPTPGRDVDEYHNYAVPDIYNNDLNLLRNELRKNHDTDFRHFYDGVRYRVVRIDTVSADPNFEKEQWVCLRRFPTKLPDIEVLNYGEANLATMKSFGRQQGLIVIGGGTGAGKTTTGIGLTLHYGRRNGGVIYMVEDPCEYIIQGPLIGNPEQSFVLQCEVKEDDQWVQAIKNALRSNPKYAYVGEVRSPKSAAQMLRLASSGHLVICTVHGGTIEQCVSALVQIAEAELGPLANQLLADSLVAIIHQSMSRGQVNMSILQAQGMADPVRSAIRDGDLKKLANSIEQQKNRSEKEVKDRQAMQQSAQTNTTRRPAGNQQRQNSGVAPRSKPAPQPAPKKFLGIF